MATVRPDARSGDRADATHLQRLAARYDALVAATADIVWTTDDAGRFVVPQPAWERFTGATVAEYLGEGYLASLHPDDRDAALAAWHAAVAARAVCDMELRLRRHDGAWRRMRVRAAPVRDAAGEVVEWVGMHVDITDQREAESARDALALEYRHFMEVNPQVPWVADREGRIVDFNRRWLELTGLTREAALGEGWVDVPHPDDLPAMQRAWQHALDTGTTYDVQHRIRTADGSHRWMHTRAWPRRDADGRIVRWYGTTEDVHERVVAQEAVRTGERLLRQAQQLEAMGRLAGGVAHDFANMLTAIIGQAELVLGELPDWHHARIELEELLRVAGRAGELARRLLDLGRTKAAAPRQVALDALVRDSAQLLRNAAGGLATVRLELAGEDCRVLVDPSQVELVLLNLVINARDAMGSGGTVTVATRRVRVGDDEAEAWYPLAPGPVGEIVVRDTGSGMDAATLERIFEPFFTTKEPGRGTGLGLPTCLNIVAQSGGALRVESAVGVGTTITMRFPEAPTPAPPVPDARPLAAPATG
jgi:PAS domain S-box-containing protein